MKKKILITGGTGLVGTYLTDLLITKGYEIVFLSREAGITQKGIKKYKWDISKNYIDKKVFEGVTSIIHLAGASVAGKRWTEDYKKEIYDSRIQATRLLVEEVKKHHLNLESVVCASAVGFYGMTTDKTIFTEKNTSSNDFLGKVTKDWEKEIDSFATHYRTVKLRIGIVFSEISGALPQMTQPVKFGVGASLGTGKQYVSWIHIHDLCSMFIETLEKSNYEGAYNAAASYPATNKEVTKAIAKILKKPLFLPNVPLFVLKIILGEMGELVVQGTFVSNEKIKKSGFQFQYDSLELTLKNLLLK